MTQPIIPEGPPLIAVVDEGLGNAGWVADLDGEVVVVDPARDPAPYLDAADALGGPVVVALETHLHADFVTGSRELAAHGASVVAAADAAVAWPHHPVVHGRGLALGRWRLRAVATPGHTPEHVAYLLSAGDRPRAVFTGGSLLVGAVARTDLVDPADTEELTRALWASIHRELLSLPDDVVVLPTHGAGSFCSAAGGTQRWTTIGDERRTNPLLQVDAEGEFVRAVLDALGSYPTYFLRLRELNRLGPRIVGALPILDRLDGLTAIELRARGGVIIDVRTVERYATGHVLGSLSIALRPQFASWLGWLVADPATPLVFVTDEHTDRRELVRQCLNIGYETLAGELSVEDWRAAGGELATTDLVGPDAADGATVLDVRQAAEYRRGHLPGARNVELGSLRDADDISASGRLLVMCGHGERAATAASLLEATGRHDVAVLRGGPADWACATGRWLAR